MPLNRDEQAIARRVALTPDEMLADQAYDSSPGNREELQREMSRGDLAPGALKLLEEQHRNVSAQEKPAGARNSPGKFDLDGARKAGYDDAEIASFLAPQFNFDLEGAQRAGYTPTEIVNHLSPPPSDHGEFMKGLIGGTIGGNPKMFGSAIKGAGTLVESDWLKQQGAALAKLGDENQVGYNPAVPSIANVRTDSVANALGDFFTKYLPYQAGNALASMAPTIASGLLGVGVGAAIAGPPGAAVGGFSGTLLSGYPMNYGDIYSDAMDDKGIQQAIRNGVLTDRDVAGITAMAAVPITALDSWSMGRFGSALTSPVKAAIYRRIFAEMKSGGLREGTTEGLQQIISEVVQHGLGSDKTISEHAVAVADNAIGGMAGGVLTGGAAGAVQRTPSAATLSEAQPVGAEPQPAAPNTQYRDYLAALDQAPTADAAVAAAAAAVETPLAPDEKVAAFVKAEEDAQTKRQADEEAAYRQRDERIASLNRQIEMLAKRETEQIAEGKNQAEIAATESAQADARDQVRGLVAGNLQTAPDTAMARAMAGAVGVNPDEAFAARGRDMLARMEAWQAKQPVAQETQQPATPALSDEEIARQMTASIPENFTPAAPLPAATPAVTIMGATPDKLTTPELRISAEAAAKPEQRQAAKVELDRRAKAYKQRGMLLPENDSLFTAIAKLGGLNKQDVVSSWGTDLADVKKLTPVFGKPLLRTTGGLSIDGMAELLVQHGYLDQRDLQEFEHKFDQELRGNPVLTTQGMERQAAATAEATAEQQALDERAARLDLSEKELASVGYDKLNAAEQEQYQTILDNLVQSAQGKPYEALVDEIIERAIVQTEGRPFKEYAQAVIAQINEVIHAQSTVNQPAQTVSGTGVQGAQEDNSAPHQQGRTEPVRQVANGLALTGQTAAEVKAQGAAAQREAAAKKQREAAPPPEEFTLAGSNRAADQATAHGQQELAVLPAEAVQKTGIISDRPYKDTATKALQKIAHETDDDAVLKAVEDELNLRAEEKASAREERLAKGREAKTAVAPEKPAEAPKRFETPGAKEAVDAAEAALKAVKPATEMTAAEHLRAAADKLEQPDSTKEKVATGQQLDLTGRPSSTENTDVGENLWYNRRNFTGKALKWDDVKGLNDTLKVKEVVKSKVWPRPDYEQLVADGMQPFFARMLKKVYDGISVEPNGKADADLERYIAVVGRIRKSVFDWAKDNNANVDFMNAVVNRAKPYAQRGPVSVLDMMKTESKHDMRSVILDRVWPRSKVDRMFFRNEGGPEIRVIGGNRALQALQFTLDDAVQAMKDIEKGWPASQEAWQRQGYRIAPSSLAVVNEGARYDKEHKSTPLWSVATAEGWKGMTIGESYESKAEAEAAKATLKPFMLLDKRGRLISQHDTEDKAKEVARETTKRENKGGELRGMNIGQAEREGPARRADEDVSAQRLMDTFGFRGVNFGREGWINQAERQAYLNHAYDGLHDLAEIIGVPPKALSLNGMLGIAFGAQGRGGQHAAHFVPGVNEINLTKTMGAGTLSHEWGHALDHYFGSLAGLGKNAEPFLSEHAIHVEHTKKVAEARKEKAFEGVRPEMVAAFKTIVDAMEKRPMTQEEHEKREVSYQNSVKNTLENWLKHFRQDVDRGVKGNPSTTAVKEFEQLADRLRRGDMGEGYMKVGQMQLPQVIAQIRLLIKDLQGHSTDIPNNWKGLTNAASSVRYTLTKREAAAAHAPQDTTTTTYKRESNAKDSDKKGKRYWSTTLEMFARAFETYVADKLADAGQKNTFLSDAALRAEAKDQNGGFLSPYPRGEERKTINAAMGKLVDAIKTQDTEKGTALFSRGKNQSTIPTQPDETYRAQTDKLEAALKAEGYDFKVTPVSLPERVAGRNSEGQHDEGSGRRDSLALASRISGVFGKEVIPVTLDGDWNADGVVLPGSPLSKYVFLDVRSDKPAHVVLGHELSHHMERDAPDVYKDLVQALQPMLDVEGYREARSTIGPSEDYIVKEMIGDLLGNNFGDQKFWAEVAKRSTAFGEIVVTIRQWLAGLVAKLKGMTGFRVEQFVSDVEGARKVLAAATVDYLRNRGNGVGGYEAKFARPIADSKTTGDYKDTFAAKATDFMTNYFTSFDKIGWWQKTVGTPFNLALTNKEFAPFYDEGQAYINDISRYGNESADLAPDLLPRVEHFKDVLPAWLGGKATANRQDTFALQKALYAGTLWGGGSPKEGRVWTDAELRSGRAMDNGVSIPAFQPMSVRQISLYRQSLASSSHTINELSKSIIQRIARQADVGFNRGMSLEDIAAIVDQQLDDKIGAAKNAENATLLAELQTAKTSIADVADIAKKLNAAGYFPAMRFGKYALHVVKGTKQLYFGMYESKAQALVAEQKLKQEFPGAEIQKGIVPKEKYKLFQGLSLDALEAFSDYIVDAEGNKVAKDALVQGLLKAATAERSVMKRHIHRKGIPGYSEDVPRVLASFVVSSARAIASNYHAAEMLKLAEGIKSGDVSDYAAKLARYMLDPVEEAQGLRGFLFAQYLGGSIASGLVNMTQPWMVTAPWMSHYTSYADAVAKLGKAGAENADALTGKIGDAYRRAKREGIVTPQEIHQLRAETGGGLGARSLAMRKLSFAWGSIFSLAEQFNRKSTFLAAFRIAEEMSKEDKAKHDIGSSYDFAKEAVAATQFTYNKGNRPVVSRGAFGATVMTFKQFSISYLEMAHRLYKTDKKAFALLALTLLAAGGIEGLPFAEDMEDLVDTMGQWLGYATNSKKKVRQWAMTILGPDLSQVALRGVSGLSWMPVDISARMGMANLIPGTAALKPSEKNKTRDVVEMLGPAGQFLPLEGTMMGNALERLGKGDLGGAIKSAAPQAIQAAVKGGQMLETGKATDLRGRKITDVSPGEAVLKMTGLQPASVARESQRIGIVQQDIDLHNRMESEIAEQWARGIADKEPAEVKAAREKLAQWNRDNEELRIKIDSRQIQQRIKAMRMSREERFVKSAPREIRAGVRDALR